MISFLGFSLFSVEFDLEKITQSIEKIHNWKKNKIKKELNIFLEKRFFYNDIIETFKYNPYCLLVTIIDSKPTYSSLKISDFIDNVVQYRGDPYKDIINFLCAHKPIPDCAFVLYLGDGTPPKQNCKSPIFVCSKKISDDHAICIPAVSLLVDMIQNKLRDVISAAKKFSWPNKKEKLFWRGADTGVYTNYKKSPRFALVEIGSSNPQLIDAKFNMLAQTPWVDISTKKEIEDRGFLGNSATIEEHLAYKYQITVDGNVATWERFYWQLFSNSVIFKQNSDDIEFYYDELKPWIHYIPVNNDMSDLVEKIFFAQSANNMCQEISQNANKFANDHLKREDLIAYIYHMINEYSKLQKFHLK